MSKLGAFLAGFVLAAAAAGGGWWIAVRPHVAGFEARAAAAERAEARAKRAAAGDQGWAESERRRRLEVETENAELKRMLTSGAAPRPNPAPGHTAIPAADLGGDLPPEQWERSRRYQEIELLSQNPRAVITNPRFPLVIAAMRAHLDEDVSLCAQVLGSDLPSEMKSVCATLLARLEDPRGVQPLLAVWSKANDPNLRAAVLRGLAEIPGDRQTPILLGVWNDPVAEPILRALAIHGLARRRHDVAVAVVAGGAPGSTPPLRLQVMNTFQSEQVKNGWSDTALVPVFGRALLSADGDPQRKLALLVLEGFWSKDSLTALETFAEAAGTSDLAARARRAADAIAKGEPRPAGAGAAKQTAGVVPADAAPPEPGAPANPDPDSPK